MERKQEFASMREKARVVAGMPERWRDFLRLRLGAVVGVQLFSLNLLQDKDGRLGKEIFELDA